MLENEKSTILQMMGRKTKLQVALGYRKCTCKCTLPTNQASKCHHWVQDGANWLNADGYVMSLIQE